MSVVIKDMEMPKTCEECPFHSYHSKGEYVCIATPMFYPMNLANSKGMRKDWCPLSEMPERKKGKWIDKSGGIEGAWNYCSVCGEQAIDLYDFCPNCGADMRGEKNETD